MKDVISILQSRVAKRKKEFFKLTMPLYKDEDVFGRSEYNKIRDGLKPNHLAVVALAEQQKQDKRILAEIVKLRREVKQQRRRKALLVAVNHCPEMSEQEVLELAARWGE